MKYNKIYLQFYINADTIPFQKRILL